jgi:hypothetical protein
MWAAFKRVAPVVFLGVLPVVVLATAAYTYHHGGNLGNDFRFELYPEAKAIVHGHDPFPSPHADLSSGQNEIFPIPAALLVAPLTLLPRSWAANVDALILLALLAGTLRILGVRDWRVYGVVGLWAPAYAAVQTGNLTIVLGFLVALAWRFRDRPWTPGLAIGVAIALKLFLWPLFVWLVAVKRYRAAATAAALGLVGGVLLVLPFESVGNYIRLIDNLRGVFGPQSYNVLGFFALSGAGSQHLAVVVQACVGLAVLGLAYVRSSLPLAIAASLVLSPIVWTHYFALLVIPLAIRWPRLALPWFIPIVMVFCPGTGVDVRLWHVILGMSVLVAVTVLVEWGPDRLGLPARHRRLAPQQAASR